MWVKIKKISTRHEMPVVKAILYELFIRAYSIRPVRNVLKWLFRVEQPLGMIFLVGSYNAGTTVIKDAIALHPDVTTAPIEGDNLTSEIDDFESGGWPRALYGNAFTVGIERDARKINASTLLSDWRPWIQKDKFFFDKSISNSVRVGLLRNAFERSKFICVVREPSDVVKGIKKRSRPYGDAREILGTDEYPDKFLYKQWAYIYGLILNDFKKNDTYLVKYEDFINRPREVLCDLYHQLGLREVNITFCNNELSIDGRVINIRPLARTHESVPSIIDYLKHKIMLIDRGDEKSDG